MTVRVGRSNMLVQAAMAIWEAHSEQHTAHEPTLYVYISSTHPVLTGPCQTSVPSTAAYANPSISMFLGFYHLFMSATGIEWAEFLSLRAGNTRSFGNAKQTELWRELPGATGSGWGQ